MMAHGCFDKDLRLRSADGVSVGAQASHSGGSPMSQRECAGFNWPPLSIPAQEPVSISPEAVSRAGPGSRCTAISAVLICGSVGLRPDVIGGRGLASTTVLFGVGHPVSAIGTACPSVNPKPFPLPVRSAHSLRRCSRRCKSFGSYSFAAGVGHPAKPAAAVIFNPFLLRS